MYLVVKLMESIKMTLILKKLQKLHVFHEMEKSSKTTNSYLHVIRFQMETKKVATIVDCKSVTIILA